MKIDLEKLESVLEVINLYTDVGGINIYGIIRTRKDNRVYEYAQLVRVVTLLEKAGFIYSKMNGRERRLFLTKEGKEIYIYLNKLVRRLEKVMENGRSKTKSTQIRRIATY